MMIASILLILISRHLPKKILTACIVKCKEIQEDALLDCIKNSMRHNYISSGLLPPNCLHIEIDSDGNKSYCLWYPWLYADISYHETAYPSFPLPRLVFAFHADTEGKISECRMGVVADERPTMETVMYRYPFSNVGGSMGTILHWQKRSATIQNAARTCQLADIPAVHPQWRSQLQRTEQQTRAAIPQSSGAPEGQRYKDTEIDTIYFFLRRFCRLMGKLVFEG